MTTEITLKNVRLAFMHLAQPHAAAEGAEPKYSVTCIVPKSDKAAVDAIKAAATAAKEKKWGGQAPKGLRNPLRDGDEKDDEGNYLRGEEFRGSYYISGSSKKPVRVELGADRRPCPPEHMVSGYFGTVSLNLFGYEAAGNRGVAGGLNLVWITKRGEPLGKRVEIDTAGVQVEDDFETAAAKLQSAAAVDDEVPF
jgi:hypothetical protein